MTIQRVQEQRERETNRLMAAVGLECHLRNLMVEILGGGASKLQEFQQYVQFAAPELRDKLLTLLGGKS